MKALDAYRDTLKELDKYESPTFTVRDFNYFYGKAVNQWISENYSRFDVIQKEVDDLRSIYKVGHPLTVTGLSTSLPTDYRHILDVRLKVKFLKDVGIFRKDGVHEVYPLRLKSSQKGFRLSRNAFHKPNHKRCYFEIYGSTIGFQLDTSLMVVDTEPTNLNIDYVSEPGLVYLNPDKSSDYNNVANNTVLFFNTGTAPNHVYYEIINVVRAIFLENIESRRAGEAIRQSLTQ